MAINDNQDSNYLNYIKMLEPILADHGENTMEFQANQVNGLAKLEFDFRKALVRHPRGLECYEAFITKSKNILTARPFFRERDTTFKAHISKALKNKDAFALTRFNINFQFATFVMSLGGWEKDAKGRKIIALYEKITKLRNSLIECNLPLAISQARTFFGRNPQSHLTPMDFMQIANVGLASGVDKFVGPYTRTFRAVLIGRMVGELIEENSQTWAHLYPRERKGLYRLRKILRKLPQDGLDDYAEIHKELNAFESRMGDPLTSKEEVTNLLAASQMVMASGLPVGADGEEEQTGLIERHPDSADLRPDSLLEAAQIKRKMVAAIYTLPLVERKLLIMRGLELD